MRSRKCSRAWYLYRHVSPCGGVIARGFARRHGWQNRAMPRPVHALIHTAALAHNLKRARAAAPDAKVWAVVKANAYGHGIERAYVGLPGADGFALLDLAEA